ncbi:MAG: putative ABC transporter permease subunit [Thermoanaerobaculia bacterium]
MNAGAVSLASSLRAAGRSLSPRSTAEAAGVLAVVVFSGAFLAGEYAGLAFLLRLGRSAATQLPALVPEVLLERLLLGAFAGAGVLLLLGALTTAVSTLFLSEELLLRMALPIPHARLLLRQVAATIALASGPAILVALPAVVLAARSDAAGAAALGAAFLAVAVLAGAAGSALALAVVAVFPPRRARLLAAFLSATGLAVAIVGARGARPERFLDPSAALDLLLRAGTMPLGEPGGNPVALAARAAARALAGDVVGLLHALLLLGGSVLLTVFLAHLLAPLHLRLLRRSREEADAAPRRRVRREAASAERELIRAEVRTLLRDAATPAQLGTLAAVFVLDLLNLKLLPGGDAASRDLVHGLQSGLGLFLVSALALRFAFPAISTDGRAALLLKSLPVSAARHLLFRWTVRAAPSLAAALLLAGASAWVLEARGFPLGAAVAVAAVGGLAIPAIQLGLGAILPRYDAPNPVSVALGPGGLVAMGLSTLLSLAPVPIVSEGLRGLVETLLGTRLDGRVLLAAWCAATSALAAAAMLAAARRLPRADVSAS